MKALDLHGWQVTTAEAKGIQLRLAGKLSLTDEAGSPSLVAGVDVAMRPGGVARGAVIALSYPELEVVESQTAEVEVRFPYVPGLLSFRESPPVLAACEKLRATPGLMLIDAQGYAHPRRFGLASHLGLLLDTPSVGCAKSLLCGTHDPVPNEAGAYRYVVDGDETIGAALRTRPDTSLVYVSIGHKVDLDAALRWAMACVRGYRLPEPCRLAHLLATRGTIPPTKR